MSNTYKDKPAEVQFGLNEDGYTNYKNRKGKKHHPRLLRDRYSACPYGSKCCGDMSGVYNARAIEKRNWKYLEATAN